MVELGEHGFEARGGVGAGVDGLEAVRPEGEGHGGEVLGFVEMDGARLEIVERGAEAGEFELFFEDLAAGLFEEEVVGIVTMEDFVEKGGAGLDLALGTLRAAGWCLEDEAGDAGDFAELSAGELCGVHALDEVFEEVFLGEMGADGSLVEKESAAGVERESVVVLGRLDGFAGRAGNAEGHERAEAFMGEPAGEGEEKEMLAFP